MSDCRCRSSAVKIGSTEADMVAIRKVEGLFAYGFGQHFKSQTTRIRVKTGQGMFCELEKRESLYVTGFFQTSGTFAHYGAVRLHMQINKF